MSNWAVQPTDSSRFQASMAGVCHHRVLTNIADVAIAEHLPTTEGVLEASCSAHAGDGSPWREPFRQGPSAGCSRRRGSRSNTSVRPSRPATALKAPRARSYKRADACSPTRRLEVPDPLAEQLRRGKDRPHSVRRIRVVVLEMDSCEFPDLLSHQTHLSRALPIDGADAEQPNPNAAPARDLDRADDIICM